MATSVSLAATRVNVLIVVRPPARRRAHRVRCSCVRMLFVHHSRQMPSRLGYRSLDKLIAHVNADGRVRAQYSTPDAYTIAKHAERIEWPVYTSDLMTICQEQPESSGLRGHFYWARYYTSRPLLKGYAREQRARCSRRRGSCRRWPSSRCGSTWNATPRSRSFSRSSTGPGPPTSRRWQPRSRCSCTTTPSPVRRTSTSPTTTPSTLRSAPSTRTGWCTTRWTRCVAFPTARAAGRA